MSVLSEGVGSLRQSVGSESHVAPSDGCCHAQRVPKVLGKVLGPVIGGDEATQHQPNRKPNTFPPDSCSDSIRTQHQPNRKPNTLDNPTTAPPYKGGGWWVSTLGPCSLPKRPSEWAAPSWNHQTPRPPKNPTSLDLNYFQPRNTPFPPTGMGGASQ